MHNLPEWCSPVVHAILAQWPVATLATYGKDRIDAVPVVFWCNAELQLHVPHDGKPKRDGRLQRFRNVDADSRCTLLMQHYAPDWQQLWWLRLNGRARTRRLPDEARAGLAAKYPQYAETTLHSEAMSIEIYGARFWSARANLAPGAIAEMLTCTN